MPSGRNISSTDNSRNYKCYQLSYTIGCLEDIEIPPIYILFRFSIIMIFSLLEKRSVYSTS